MAKTLFGKVTSAKADKTISVTVTSRETHPIYRNQEKEVLTPEVEIVQTSISGKTCQGYG